jgi:hypothetical protein
VLLLQAVPGHPTHTAVSNKPLPFWLTPTKLLGMTGIRYVNSHPLIRGIEDGWNYSVRDAQGRVFVASNRGNAVGQNCIATEHSILGSASITDLLYCVGNVQKGHDYQLHDVHLEMVMYSYVNWRCRIITIPVVRCDGWCHLSVLRLSAWYLRIGTGQTAVNCNAVFRYRY